MSPKPNSVACPGRGTGCQISGMIVRVMMFQSLLSSIGIHRLDVEDVLRPLLRPEVEIGVVLERHADQVADGFCASFANSSALSSARAGAAATSIAAQRVAASKLLWFESSCVGVPYGQLRRVVSHVGTTYQAPAAVPTGPWSRAVPLLRPMVWDSFSGALRVRRDCSARRAPRPREWTSRA